MSLTRVKDVAFSCEAQVAQRGASCAFGSPESIRGVSDLSLRNALHGLTALFLTPPVHWRQNLAQMDMRAKGRNGPWLFCVSQVG